MARRPLAAVPLAFLATLPAAAPGTSGLTGVLRRGPITPVCIAGKPCTAPAPGVKLQFVRGGRIAGAVTTAAGGRYRILLRPGRYAVRVSPEPRIGRGLEPSTVVVPRDRVGRVDFSLDTGIR